MLREWGWRHDLRGAPDTLTVAQCDFRDCCDYELVLTCAAVTPSGRRPRRSAVAFAGHTTLKTNWRKDEWITAQAS